MNTLLNWPQLTVNGVAAGPLVSRPARPAPARPNSPVTWISPTWGFNGRPIGLYQASETNIESQQDAVGQLSVALDVIDCVAAAAAGPVLRQQAGVGRAEQAAAVHWLTRQRPPQHSVTERLTSQHRLALLN